MNAFQGPFGPEPVRLVISPCLHTLPLEAGAEGAGENPFGTVGAGADGAATAAEDPSKEEAIVDSNSSAGTAPIIAPTFFEKFSNVSPPITKIRPSGSLLLT